MRQALKAVAPNTPLGTVEAWPDRLRSRTAEPRLLMTTLTAFGALAAFLAALGVYGLFSWSVALRQRELAIRLALGARPAAVGAGVVRRSAVLVAIGLILGLGLVQASRSLLATVLFGITPHDLVSLATGGALLFVAAVASSSRRRGGRCGSTRWQACAPNSEHRRGRKSATTASASPSDR